MQEELFNFCTKIIVYVKTLVKIFLKEFLLNAFIAKKLPFCATVLHPLELFPVLDVV